MSNQIKTQPFACYFDLQLRFARAVLAVGSARDFADAVTRFTNLHRRFGLGRISTDRQAEFWQDYLQELTKLHSNNDRLACTIDYFMRSPEEQPPPDETMFGCFSCSPPAENGMIRIHFMNRTSNTATGPLHRDNMTHRRNELRAMFVFIESHYPTARFVRGTSWLYNTKAYRRLFPTTYVTDCTPVTSSLRYHGSSSWGQFLNHQQYVKPELRRQFLLNLETLDPGKLWAAFPLMPLRAEAPIAAFFDFYGAD